MQKLNAVIAENPIPEGSNTLTPREEAARRFIVTSFSRKMSSLIPFALASKNIVNLASYILKYTKAKSKHTLYQYVFGIHRFCDWKGITPDDLVKDASRGKAAIKKLSIDIDKFVGDLEAENIAPGTINNHVKGVKALLRVNSISLTLPFRIQKDIRYPDRAPSPEELARIIDLGDIRDKVLVSLLALAGFRVGTLVKLQYRHVKDDLERGVSPVHLHIEADITKGKYGDYDTFIGAEAVDYLKTYLNSRRVGTLRFEAGKTRGMPPEQIANNSPLIRNEHKAKVEPITEGEVWTAIHGLLCKAEIVGQDRKVRYEVRPHSIRKYFRTQLGATSMKNDYIDYMMGHKVSTYNDIKGQGIDYLRNLYAASGLSIRPKTAPSKMEQLKMAIRSFGYDPDSILVKDAFLKPNRTIYDPETYGIEVLNQALKQAIIAEINQQKASILEPV